jgi:hypothetical protein
VARQTAATVVVATVPTTMARRETSPAERQRLAIVFATMIHRYSPVSAVRCKKAVNTPLDRPLLRLFQHERKIRLVQVRFTGLPI